MYASLRRRVVEAGLLDRAYAYYTWRTGLSFAILIVGLALTSNVPVAAAVLIACGLIQVALVGHDAGHLGVFETLSYNTWLADLCWTLTCGISFRYWNDRHLRHHASTNDPTEDPDVQWSFGRTLVPLMAFTFRIEGWRFALTTLKGGLRVREVSLLSLSLLLWLAPVVILGWRWLAIYIGSQVLASLYLAAIVATNHIGMPMPAGNTFLEQQLRTSRNVLPNPITNFFFGGLNYQIEHHLFTTMPRPHLAAARRLVRPFCAAHGLPYAEGGIVSVYRDVLLALPRLSG